MFTRKDIIPSYVRLRKNNLYTPRSFASRKWEAGADFDFRVALRFKGLAEVGVFFFNVSSRFVQMR